MVTLVGTIVGLLGLGLSLYTEFENVFAIAILCVGAGLFTATSLYSIRVREKVLALQGSARLLHEINHTYRDVLTKVCDRNPPVNTDERMTVERDTVQTVCQRISEIYTALIARRCTVTVKVVEQDGTRWFCRTYARSESHSRRDQANLVRFALGTGENTAFDVATQPRPGGGISHFFAPDLRPLRKKKEYRNQRDDFEHYYRSEIVVPIRFLDYCNNPQANSQWPIGFLSVDTLSVNYLNNGYHLEFLAAFADQMYNFFSLLRGKYRLPNL